MAVVWFGACPERGTVRTGHGVDSIARPRAVQGAFRKNDDTASGGSAVSGKTGPFAGRAGAV